MAGDDEAALPTEGTASQHAVRCALPAFWANSPQMWFRRVESQFHVSAVTVSKTKAALVFSQLDEVAAGFVTDVSLDGEDPYTELKAALMAACGKTKRQRVAELIDCPAMGAETPERYGVRLTQLAEGLVIGDVVREVFLRGIPRDVAKTLINHEGEFGELTKKAGSFFTSSGASISSASEFYATPAFSDSPAMQDLYISDPPASASAAWPRQPRPRNMAPRQRPDDTRAFHSRQERPDDTRAFHSRQGGGDAEHRNAKVVCFYHRKYGRNAHQCEGRCVFSGNAPTGNRR